MLLPPDFPYDPAKWTDTERAAYVESRRFQWPPKMFSEEKVAHLADVQGIIRWPKTPEPEVWKTKDEVLAWLKKEFGR